MKKIKQMRLKAILLTIVAVLTLGFTSCTDELASDQTQGKPGYLTLNLRTIKTKETKFADANATDYQTVKDLNVFVFDGEALLFHKFFKDGVDDITLSSAAAAGNLVSFNVGELPATAKVVVVANWGIRMPSTSTTTLTNIKELPVTTVGAFDAAKGLIMTGENGITTTGLVYSSAITIAPVASKITVKWNTTPLSEVDRYFTITGIYIVNAVNSTKLPIVGGVPTILSPINLATKTASSGLDISLFAERDFHLYYPGAVTDATNLSNTNYTTGLPAGNSYHFYVGENYHRTFASTDAEIVYDQTENNNLNANTLIVVEASVKTGAPANYGEVGDKKYYTYALTSAITPNNSAIGTTIPDGFSTKRRTNYNVNFTLDNVGAPNPFEQVRKLNVTVTAAGWEDITPTSPVF